MSNSTRRLALTVALLITPALIGACRKDVRELKGRAHQINDAAYWDGAVWFIESSGKVDETGAAEAASRLVRVKPHASAKLEQMGGLDTVEPWLLSGADRLWIISDGSVAFYKDGKLDAGAKAELPGPVSRPFIYKGRPAIIAAEPPGYRLMTWDVDKWDPGQKLRMKLPAESDECTGEYLRAFESNGVLHVFCQVPLHPPVYHHAGLPLADAEQTWEKVADAPGQWKPACLGGRPALFFHADRKGPVVVGLIRRGDRWEEFFTRSIGLDIGLGVCATGQGEDFVLLRRVLPLGTTILGVENGQPAWSFEAAGDTNAVELLLTQ